MRRGAVALLLLAAPSALAAQDAAAPSPPPQQVGDDNFGRFVTKLGAPELAKHPAAELAVLGALGAQGWELVSCQTAHLKGIMSDRDLTSCYLKRPLPGDSLRAAS